VPEALAELAESTDAELVQIWAVDLSSNSQRFLAARRHDGERPVIPSPRRLPIIDHASDVRKLVEILDGKPTCVDLGPEGTPVARRLYERGMRRGCAIPIPPTAESFVAVIYLSWPKATDASTRTSPWARHARSRNCSRLTDGCAIEADYLCHYGPWPRRPQSWGLFFGLGVNKAAPTKAW
jgi:hypothetical protein